MSDLSERTFELCDGAEPWRVIRGVVAEPRGGSAAAVLCLHGFKGFMDWGFFPTLRGRLVEAGFTAVAFNTSCNGVGADRERFTEEEAFARNTWTRELEDIAAVRDHLDGLADRWGILGHSRGGGSALLHSAARGDYRAIVTWAGVAYALRYSPDTLAAWRASGSLPIVNARTGQKLRLDVEVLDDAERNAARLDILAACRQLDAPALFVHGAEDEAVSVDECESLHAAFGPGVSRRLVVDGAGHTFGAVHPFAGTTGQLEEVLRATLEHFRSTLA